MPGLNVRKPGLLSCERGLGKIGFLFGCLVLGAGLWLLYNVIPIYYAYLEIEGHMEAVAKTAQMQSDLEIRKFLLQKIRELDIPADPEELVVERFNGQIHIDLEYEELLSVPYKDKYYDLYTFRFHPHISRTVPEKTRR